MVTENRRAPRVACDQTNLSGASASLLARTALPEATPIRMLAAMRDVALQRNHTVDLAADGANSALWAKASRSWSRQSSGLMRAIIEEPPRDLEDVTLLLLNLIEWRSEVDDFDVGDQEVVWCQEATDTALHSVIIFLSRTIRPNAEWSGETLSSFDWSQRILSRRLPDPTASEWARAKAEYEECAAIADAAAPDDVDAADERKSDAEDRLMAIPAPDAEAFALKYLIAHGGGRDTDCWNGMLDADARRLTGDAS